MFKLSKIPDWKSAWKFSTVQWSLLGTIIMMILEAAYQGWITVPPHLMARIPNAQSIATVLFLAIMVGRVLKVSKDIQEITHDKE